MLLATLAPAALQAQSPRLLTDPADWPTYLRRFNRANSESSAAYPVIANALAALRGGVS